MFNSCHVVDECESTDLWLVDSACGNHMTRNKFMFSSLDVSVITKVKLGDNHLVDVHGKGIIYVMSKHNEVKEILHVYHVNGLKHNLISVGQLTQNGYQVIFKVHACTILDKPSNKCLISHITMTKNTLYPLWMKCLTQYASFA